MYRYHACPVLKCHEHYCICRNFLYNNPRWPRTNLGWASHTNTSGIWMLFSSQLSGWQPIADNFPADIPRVAIASWRRQWWKGHRLLKRSNTPTGCWLVVRNARRCGWHSEGIKWARKIEWGITKRRAFHNLFFPCMMMKSRIIFTSIIRQTYISIRILFVDEGHF